MPTTQEYIHPNNVDSSLQWLNPPQHYYSGEKALVIKPEAHTDFWQKTHYGFTPDNGHFLFAEIEGDFVLTTSIIFYPRHQYDQAGLMIRCSPTCWLKTSVEFEPEGASKLGAVVTNHGYSDWSTQEFLPFRNQVSLRIRREGSDYIVEYLKEDDMWVQMRMAHLMEDDGTQQVKAGLYACSPIGAGFEAHFTSLQINPGRISQV
jgi:regulation of enolase protein 1 (concanavalin A-like superfamily)